MWTIIKFEKKSLSFLKSDLENKLGTKCKIYIPKLLYKKFAKKKLIRKEFNLLGDYLFCFNEKFSDTKVIKIINYSRGLKVFYKALSVSKRNK